MLPPSTGRNRLSSRIVGAPVSPSPCSRRFRGLVNLGVTRGLAAERLCTEPTEFLAPGEGREKFGRSSIASMTMGNADLLR